MLEFEGKEFNSLGELKRWLHVNSNAEEIKRDWIKGVINSYRVEFRGKSYETKEELRLFLKSQKMIYDFGSLHLLDIEVPCGSDDCYKILMKLLTCSFTDSWIRAQPLIISSRHIQLLDVYMPRKGQFSVGQDMLVDKILCSVK